MPTKQPQPSSGPAPVPTATPAPLMPMMSTPFDAVRMQLAHRGDSTSSGSGSSGSSPTGSAAQIAAGMLAGRAALPAAVGFKNLYGATRAANVPSILNGGFDTNHGGTGASAAKPQWQANAKNKIYLGNYPTASAYSQMPLSDAAKASPIRDLKSMVTPHSAAKPVLKVTLPYHQFLENFAKDPDNALQYLKAGGINIGSQTNPVLNGGYYSHQSVPPQNVSGGAGNSVANTVQQVVKGLPKSFKANPARMMAGQAVLMTAANAVMNGVKNLTGSSSSSDG